MTWGPVAECWLRAADEQLGAALSLRESHPRASISRAYYAVYAICCACFEDLGLPKLPTSDGNDMWYPHQVLRVYVEELVLMANGKLEFDKPLREHATQLVRSVEHLKGLRVLADYKPESKHQTEDAKASCHQAAGLIDALRALVEDRRDG